MNKPEILYKYRCWDDVHPKDKRILTELEIFFSSPAKLNDPFDTRISSRYDLCTNEQIIKIMRNRLREDQPQLNRTQIRERARKEKKKGLYKNPRHIIEMERWDNDYKNRNFGIFSLSAIKDNFLMWSHYSGSHTGFCVGFSAERLDKFFDYFLEKTGKIITLFKVDYEKEYPILNPYNYIDKVDEEMRLHLSVKSEDWVYEDEYRFILSNGTDLCVKLAPGIIQEVILGCKMDEASIDDIKKALRIIDDDIKLFRATKCKDRFALNFDPINY